MRSQRVGFEDSGRPAARERRAERRWRMLFQGLFFGAPLVLGTLYFLFFLCSAGFHWGPFGSVVGIVRIECEIAAGKVGSADEVVPC